MIKQETKFPTNFFFNFELGLHAVSREELRRRHDRLERIGQCRNPPWSHRSHHRPSDSGRFYFLA